MVGGGYRIHGREWRTHYCHWLKGQAYFCIGEDAGRRWWPRQKRDRSLERQEYIDSNPPICCPQCLKKLRSVFSIGLPHLYAWRICADGNLDEEASFSPPDSLEPFRRRTCTGRGKGKKSGVWGPCILPFWPADRVEALGAQWRSGATSSWGQEWPGGVAWARPPPTSRGVTRGVPVEEMVSPLYCILANKEAMQRFFLQPGLVPKGPRFHEPREYLRHWNLTVPGSGPG